MLATTFVFLLFSAGTLLTVGEGPTLIVGELPILLVPLIYLLLKRVDIRRYAKIDFHPKYFLVGLGCGGLLLVLNIVVSAALTFVFGNSQAVEDSNTMISGLSATPSGLVLVAVSLALAGICEEFAFRGFLQNSIFKGLSNNPRYAKTAFWAAVVISAAVFGLFHFDPQGVYVLSAFISGLALGGIYHRWNYTASMTAHASMNLMVLALLMLGI